MYRLNVKSVHNLVEILKSETLFQDLGKYIAIIITIFTIINCK